MIIARFMEVSLGYARIEVNTVRRRKDDKGLGPDLWMAELRAVLARLGVMPRAFEPLEDQRRPSDRARHNRAYFIYLKSR
jgi:sugar phosphate isomerase/epimerase